ncbi:MAG: hypothetical protein KBC43_00325 [Bacteroidales bacterium]|nr:hypothetical protein [Bacteroidales bacterium]
MKVWLPIWFFMVTMAPTAIAQFAPVTVAGRVTGATPGDPAVSVPVTVTGFTDIAQFTITLRFDTTKVKFVSSSANPLLPGMAINYTPPSGNSFGKLIFSLNNNFNTSLPDSSDMAMLTFKYVNGTGNLTWAYTFGSVCQYKRLSGGVPVILPDSPKYQFYQNGGISDRGAPHVYAPVFPNPVTGPLSLAVNTSGFTGIASFNLSLDYDPAFIVYQNSFTKNPAFDSNFIVGDNPGSNGLRRLVIQWYGSPVTLADGTEICTLNFSYPSARCDASLLTWYDSGPTCEFTDAGNNVLIDLPRLEYYSDGLVTEGLASTWTGAVDSDWTKAGNWNICGIPDDSKNVVIPNIAPNTFPVISDTLYCKSMVIEPGATLTISQTGVLVIGE